ncbi:MAG: ATP-binding protein [Bdellovibrionota bacterium]
MNFEIKIRILCDSDVLDAIQKGRSLLQRIEMPLEASTLVSAAISEVSRNILEYADRGEILIRIIEENSVLGLCVVASDSGPGIPDIERSMQDGYSTGKGLGLGLSGAKRSMDEFEIDSAPGKGTVITMRKWVR